MTIEERKDRLMHIILNCGDDEVLLSQLERTVMTHSEWGRMIRESYPGTVAREKRSKYGGGELTPAQLEGLREAQESISKGDYSTSEEIWEEFDNRYGFR